MDYLHIDDAVGAIPVHLGAGIWGTLAVAIFGKEEDSGNRPKSLGTTTYPGDWNWSMLFVDFWFVLRFFQVNKPFFPITSNRRR